MTQAPMTEVNPWWVAFRAGDLAAFTTLIERYQDDVFAVAFATVVDHGLAEDIAQETFIAAHFHRHRLRDPAALGGWLAVIARNLGRDLLRARRRESLVEPLMLDIATDAEPPDHQIDRATLCANLQRVLARIPARYREVLVLFYLCERSVAWIARSLGQTESATMQRLSRGRGLMRRHGRDLREHLGEGRRRRSLVVGVLALLAIRSRGAEAARSGRSSGHSILVGVVGLGMVMGLVAVIDASQAASVAAAIPSSLTQPPTPPFDSRMTTPAASSMIIAHPTTKPSRPRSSEYESVRTTDDHHDAVTEEAYSKPPTVQLTVEPYRIVTEDAISKSPKEPLPTNAECSKACAVVSPAPRPTQRFDQINGMLETAALPRAGEIFVETIGTQMIVRAGVTRHLAVHIGIIPMNTDQGTPAANASPAFGGGIKLGAPIGRHASIALLVEGARETNLKTVSTGEGWIGRGAATLTLRRQRDSVTLVGGVISSFDGSRHWTSPVIGISSYLGWDDRLGFVLENQWFTTPNETINQMSVLAVRFRNDDVPDLLGINRVRLDVGTMLLGRTNDEIDMLPWLQVGFGW